MDTEDTRAVASRLRTALDLFDAGVAMKRQQIRREHPHLSAPAVEARVIAWLRTRPGAEHGDAPGRTVRLRTAEVVR